MKKILSYEEMWEIVFKLCDGKGQGSLAEQYGVSRRHIAAIAKEYDVGCRSGQSSRTVQRETKHIENQIAIGLKPEISIRIKNKETGQRLPIRIKKYLLGPAEKAEIIAGMKKTPGLSALAYAQEFKRLPATIVKIAAEAGIILR